MLERQELHCHACGRYVQFSIDVSLNGNHVLNCPNCDHEHCRVVENGRITEARWDSRNVEMTTVHYITSSNVSSTMISTFDSCSTSGSFFLYESWTNSGLA